MAKVHLGDDPFIPGRRIEVDSTGFNHGDDCQMCRAVRLAQTRLRSHPDCTLPPVVETGFEVVE